MPEEQRYWLPDPSPWQQSYTNYADVERAAQARSAEVLRGLEARRQREAEEARAKERAEQERGRAELAAYREQAQGAYLSSGGTAVDFQTAWPKLQAEYLAERARERLTGKERRIAVMTEKLRASGVYSF